MFLVCESFEVTIFTDKENGTLHATWDGDNKEAREALNSAGYYIDKVRDNGLGRMVADITYDDSLGRGVAQWRR